jgi:hypothetical protein
MSKCAHANPTSGTRISLSGRLADLRRVVQEVRAALTGHQQIALGVFVVFVTIQIAVPLVQLAGDRPERFGWQMFSGSGDLHDFEIITADGSVRAVETRDYVGYLRLEMEYADKLADHLCDLDAATVAVRILHDDPANDEVRACRR